jgi:hypothetical protein
MTNKKYKIAIMGAPGAGKTVFFSSYFNLVTNLGQGKPISLNTLEALKEVNRIIEALFKKQIHGKEKLKEDIISFSVDSLEMDIRFLDVPGGGSKKRRDWEDHRFLPELKSSDGVLFFISADELLKNPERTLRDNGAFQEALSFLLENNSSRWNGGKSAPVVFVFTKGDAVQDVTVEQLRDKLTELFGRDRQKSSALAAFLSEGNSSFKAFKVVSIGTWPDQKNLPLEYEPQNVITPMEELYKMMKNLERERKKIKSAAIAVAALLVASTAVTWGMDQYRWSNTKTTVRNLVAASKFEEAIRAVDSFGKSYIFPDPIPLIPSALRGGTEKEALRTGIIKTYEKEQFSTLLPLIKNMDTAKMPDVKSERYLDASRKVEEYLSNSVFRTVNQPNYDTIQSIRWYFEAGQALLGKTPVHMTEKISDSGEALGLLERWLEFMPKLPEQWKSEGAQKAGELFAFWANMLPPDAEIEQVNEFVSSAAKIAENPNATAELKKLVNERTSAWQVMISSKWTAMAEHLIQEAASLLPEEGIGKINDLMKRGDVPEVIRTTLSTALKKEYLRLGETLSGEKNAGIDTIKDTLAKYPQMPEEAKKKLEDRIVSIAKEEASRISGEIEAVQSLEALGARLSDLNLSWPDYPVGKEETAKVFEKTFARLVSSELDHIVEKGAALTEKQDFAAAKEAYIASVETLTAKLQNSGLGAFGNGAVAEASEVQVKKLEELRQSHLSACKSSFDGLNSSKNKDEIAPVIEKLKAFTDLWPDAKEVSEAKKAVTFLDAVQNGAKGVLTIVNGDFTEADSLLDTPDMKILLKKGGKTLLETKTVDNEVRPAFGEKHEFTWDVGSSFDFVGIETGGVLGSDKEIYNVSVDAGGIFGYEKLNGTLKNSGNSLTIKMEIDLPESPWK